MSRGREKTVPRLKICGITESAFALAAAKGGVDYLGLIFAERSPRRVTPEQARTIIAAVRAGTVHPPRFIGVFVEHGLDEIMAIADTLGLDGIQLHAPYGAEDVAALQAKGYEVWRLAGEGPATAAFAGEDAVLLDGRAGKRCGGTGQLADWSRVSRLKRAGHRVVLAGGISAANLREAIATGADILDVNSALETAPGVKSPVLLDELLRARIHNTSI